MDKIIVIGGIGLDLKTLEAKNPGLAEIYKTNTEDHLRIEKELNTLSKEILESPKTGQEKRRDRRKKNRRSHT